MLSSHDIDAEIASEVAARFERLVTLRYVTADALIDFDTTVLGGSIGLAGVSGRLETEWIDAHRRLREFLADSDAGGEGYRERARNRCERALARLQRVVAVIDGPETASLIGKRFSRALAYAEWLNLTDQAIGSPPFWYRLSPARLAAIGAIRDFEEEAGLGFLETRDGIYADLLRRRDQAVEDLPRAESEYLDALACLDRIEGREGAYHAFLGECVRLREASLAAYHLMLNPYPEMVRAVRAWFVGIMEMRPAHVSPAQRTSMRLMDALREAGLLRDEDMAAVDHLRRAGSPLKASPPAEAGSLNRYG